MDAIQKVLAEIDDVCPRCHLRLAGIKDSRRYHDFTDPKSGKIDNDEPDSKRIKVSPCRACLGVLQEEFVEDTLTKVCQFSE